MDITWIVMLGKPIQLYLHFLPGNQFSTSLDFVDWVSVNLHVVYSKTPNAMTGHVNYMVNG